MPTKWMRRTFVLREQDRRTVVREKTRVGCLVIVHRVGKGHQDARHAAGAELRDRDGACATDDQIRFGIPPRHIVDERQQLAVHACGLVILRQRVKMLLARLMHQRRLFGQQ